MTPTPADLEARVSALESRQRRSDDDTTALMDTVLEIREDVQVLRRDVGRLRLDVDGLTRRMRVMQNDMARMNRAVLAIVAHLGITIAREDPDGDPED